MDDVPAATFCRSGVRHIDLKIVNPLPDLSDPLPLAVSRDFARCNVGTRILRRCRCWRYKGVYGNNGFEG